jgi:hypothetical protein
MYGMVWWGHALFCCGSNEVYGLQLIYTVAPDQRQH